MQELLIDTVVSERVVSAFRKVLGLVVILGLLWLVCNAPMDGAMLLKAANQETIWFSVGLLALIYIFGGLALLPTSAVTIVAGYLLGTLAGFVMITCSALVMAVLAFALARFLLKDWLTVRLAEQQWFRNLSAGTERQGFFWVLLARLSAVVPAAPLSYGAGLLPIRFGPFLLATVIGQTPIKLSLVAMGALGQDLVHEGQLVLSPEMAWRLSIIVGGLLTLSLMTYLLRRRYGR